MSRNVEAAGDLRPGWAQAVVARCRRSFGTPSSRWLLVGTALVGLGSAVAVTVAVAPPERTFAMASATAQSLMSVTVAFLGVLQVTSLHRVARPDAIATRLLTGTALALLVATFGAVVSVVVTAISGSGPGRWQHVGAVVVGSAAVQVLAQFAGTGLGLLLRRPSVAMLGTVVLPLGLWWFLGAVKAFRPGQNWLTPYAWVGKLLAGQMSAMDWLHWLVVALIWGVGSNAVGVLRVKRRALPR
jgi:hypothetical protein